MAKRSNFFGSLERDNVSISGMEELGHTLDLLGGRAAQNAVRQAIKPGIEVFRKAIRARAPVRSDSRLIKLKRGKGGTRGSGWLKKHIGRWILANTKEGSLSAFTGPTRSAYYGRWKEKGRAAREKGSISFSKKGRARKHTRHTGAMAAAPFMKPAFDDKKNEALEVFGKNLWQNLQKAIR